MYNTEDLKQLLEIMCKEPCDLLISFDNGQTAVLVDSIEVNGEQKTLTLICGE